MTNFLILFLLFDICKLYEEQDRYINSTLIILDILLIFLPTTAFTFIWLGLRIYVYLLEKYRIIQRI